MATEKLSKQQVIAELWRRGELKWKLRPVQKKMHALFHGANTIKVVFNCSRRLGKSFVLSLIAIEHANKHPGSMIRFACPTAKALKKITLPIFREILKDCPPDVKPFFYASDSYFKFPNGSEIHLSGCINGHEENLRGQMAHLSLVDEAAFIDNLDYVVDDILVPQLLTTRGKLLMASTPPRSPAHSFVIYAQKAELTQSYALFTLDESGYDPELIEHYIAEAGGRASSRVRREYFGEFVVDEDSAIVPEWKDDFIAEPNRDEPANHLWHRYVGMDIGVRDLTVMLFGHYNFVRGRLFIEDETWINGPQMTTQVIVEMVKKKEKELWGALKPYRRISDNNNLVLINDLSIIHDLSFVPTDKEALEAMVNEVRLMVQQGRVVVSPKCKQLLGCLKYGVWDSKRKAFDRSIAYGHFDALAALVYLIRNLDKHTNPVPAHFGQDLSNSFYTPKPQLSDTALALKSVFKGTR